jgi:hypothetical protein
MATIAVCGADRSYGDAARVGDHSYGDLCGVARCGGHSEGDNDLAQRQRRVAIHSNVLCLQIVPSVLRCLWWYHERRMWWQATEAMSVEVGATKARGKQIYQ